MRRTSNYSTPKEILGQHILALSFLSSGIFLLFVKSGHLGEWVLGPGLEREKVCLRSRVGTRRQREACRGV